MLIKTFASAVIAALLLTGTPIPVSHAYGQGAQFQQPDIIVAEATLTETEAIAAALEHAKLTEDEVTEVRAKLDREDRVLRWEIHWRVGDWEYDYDIHTETGKVLEWEKDYEPRRKTEKPANPPATEPPKAENDRLTRDEALAIALRHAGLSRSGISRLETELDRDNKTWKWEIEFRSDGWEYSYDIHADSGKILDWEKEWDD